MSFKLFILIMALLFSGASAPKVSIIAKVSGENYGKVNKEVSIAESEQTIFHSHSDFEGGGTWYNVTLSLKGENVVIVERESISTPSKPGTKVRTDENIYTFPVSKISKLKVVLKHGNRITLIKK